jgi:HCO3- transporter family
MIPMPVLYGVFLYMGITSLGGVQVSTRESERAVSDGRVFFTMWVRQSSGVSSVYVFSSAVETDLRRTVERFGLP